MTSLRRRLMQESIQSIKDYLGNGEKRTVRPKLKIELFGPKGGGEWYANFSVFPSEGHALMYVGDGNIYNVDYGPLTYLKVPAGSTIRVYQIELPRMCEKKCGSRSEANRYRWCHKCWFEQDPRNRSN